MGKQLTPGVLQSYLHVGLGGGCLAVVSLTAACLLCTAKCCQPGFPISWGFMSHLDPLDLQAS